MPAERSVSSYSFQTNLSRDSPPQVVALIGKLADHHNGQVGVPPETRYARNGAILAYQVLGVPGTWEVFAVVSIFAG
jgi:hypothetical protein